MVWLTREKPAKRATGMTGEISARMLIVVDRICKKSNSRHHFKILTFHCIQGLFTLTPPSRARSEQVPTPEFLKKFHLKGDILLKIAMDILASYETQPWTMNVLQCSLENETKTTMAFTAPDMSWHQLSGPHPEHGEGG